MNDSGFNGYGIASIYPNMGNRVSQTADTIPEEDEQQAYAGVEETVQPAVDRGSKKNMLIMAAVIGGIIVLAAVAKG